MNPFAKWTSPWRSVYPLVEKDAMGGRNENMTRNALIMGPSPFLASNFTAHSLNVPAPCHVCIDENGDATRDTHLSASIPEAITECTAEFQLNCCPSGGEKN